MPSSPLRIMFIIRSLDFGGAERQVILLATELKRRGHHVALAVFYGHGPLREDVERAGITLYDLKKSGRWDLFRFLSRAVRAVRDFAPEILHGYLPSSNIIATVIGKALTRTKVVFGVRISTSGLDLSHYDWLSRAVYSIEAFLSCFADATISNSESGRQAAVARGFSPERCYVVPNGVDTSRFRFDRSLGENVRRSWGADDSKYIGMVGRIDPQKNHGVFLKAAAIAHSHDPNLKFVCVGGTENDRPPLIELSRQLGVPMIWRDGCRDVEAVYNALDILVLPSQAEGFSNVLAEAMACGLPCIASDVADNARILGTFGTVVPVDDPKALARAMLEITKSPGPAAARHVHDTYSVDLLAERTQKILSSIRENGHARTTKVALVIPMLQAGGAERVLSILANHWCSLGWSVHIVTFESPARSPYYALDPDIRLVQLDLLRESPSLFSAIRNTLWRLKALRKAICGLSPDAVLSFMDTTNIMTLASTYGLKAPIVISERNHPGQQVLSPVWSWLRRRLYPGASIFVAQTQRALDWHPAKLCPHGRVIPNPVTVSASFRGRETPKIVAVGRLSPQKGFDLLITAFARIADAYPEWTLILWGEGPERPTLETLIRDLRMTEKITMPGLSAQPGLWMQDAGIFVLPSRYEGFPNALLEAMSVGLPVIASDCVAGPAELITHGETGFLVPVDDVDALCRALRLVLDDPALRVRLGSAAQTATLRYSKDRICDLWTSTMIEAMTRTKSASDP